MDRYEALYKCAKKLLVSMVKYGEESAKRWAKVLQEEFQKLEDTETDLLIMEAH